VLVYTYNPNSWEAEAGGSQVQDQAGILREEGPRLKKKEKSIRVYNSEVDAGEGVERW
jgi:hypothetical protein